MNKQAVTFSATHAFFRKVQVYLNTFGDAYLAIVLLTPALFCWNSNSIVSYFNITFFLLLSLFYCVQNWSTLQQNRLFKLALFISCCASVSLWMFPDNGLSPYTPFWIFGVAHYLSNQITKRTYVLASVIYYLYAVICLILLFRGVNPNINPFGFSQNGLTIHLFVLFTLTQLTETMARLSERYRLNTLVMTTLLFVISVWCNGRVSILLSGFLLLATYVLCSRFSAKKIIWAQIISIVAVSLFLLNPITQAKLTHFPTRRECCAFDNGLFFGKFDADSSLVVPGEFDYFVTHQFFSPRFSFWKSYVTDLNIRSFLFGNTATTNPILLESYRPGQYNFHNSFIHMHQRYGLFGFIAYLGLLIASVLVCFKRYSRWLAIVFTCLMARAFNDMFLFNHIFDFIVWLFVMYVFVRKQHAANGNTALLSS